MTLVLHAGRVGEIVGTTHYEAGEIICDGDLTLTAVKSANIRLTEHIRQPSVCLTPMYAVAVPGLDTLVIAFYLTPDVTGPPTAEATLIRA